MIRLSHTISYNVYVRDDERASRRPEVMSVYFFFYILRARAHAHEELLVFWEI